MTKQQYFRKRKEAREWLLDHIPSKTIMPEAYSAYQTAIFALRPVSREQVEKAWRGEWICSMPILEGEDLEIRCSKCGNIVAFETDFCPSCGAPMTDEAVSIVMERLEVLYERNDD